MSTLDELDAVARRAAAALLADAPDATETDAALDAVKSGSPALGSTTAAVTRSRARAGRAPVLVATAAAAVIAIGIAGIVAVTRPESSPSGPAGVPVPTAAPIGSSAPATTLPSTFAPLPGPFALTVTPGETSAREVLYAAAAGSGDEELGDECPECDNARPHDPIITDAGAIVIFDAANHRWVVVDRGPVAIDPSIDMFELQIGRDGLIYTSAKVDDADTWSVVVWDPAQLDAPVATIPTEERGASLGLSTTDRGVAYGGNRLDYLGPETTPLGDLKVGTGGATQSVVRTYPGGASSTWTVPPGWNVELPAGLLADGSAMVNVSTGDARWLVRLFPDGTSLAMPPVQGDGVWAAPSYTLAGVSVVQRTDDGFEIARYPLPEHPSGDAPATNASSTATLTSTPPTEVPTVTTYGGSGPPPGTPFVVTTTEGPLTTAEVLYSASIGSAVDQLGYDDCQECHPARPLDPVVASDGTILLVDVVNLRLLTIAHGVPSAWPLPAGFLPEASALGYDGVLYIGGEFDIDSAARRTSVLAYSTGSPTLLQEIPYEYGLAGDMRAAPTGLAVGGSADAVIPYIGDPSAPLHAGIELPQVSNEAPHSLTIHSTSDMHITWTLPDGWTLADPGWALGGIATALEYPQAVIVAQGPNSQFLYVRLLAGGSSVAMPFVLSEGLTSAPFVDERGIVLLRRTATGFDVVRYPLPGDT